MIMSAAGAATQRAKFAPGDIVQHRRYGYRGVIVAHDLTCKADDAWYENNKTQPERDQPWYHMLVHGSASITYAAQTSLEADVEGEPIDHPYVPIFFTEYADGRYTRNDQTWPGW